MKNLIKDILACVICIFVTILTGVVLLDCILTYPEIVLLIMGILTLAFSAIWAYDRVINKIKEENRNE